jgi:hypothetical protein
MEIVNYVIGGGLLMLIGFGIGYIATLRQIGRREMKKEVDKHFRKPMREALGKLNPIFPKEIESLSPTFCEIFNQAVEAEQDGFSQICGIGYGKSLEFLVKDYAIFLHPVQKEIIEKSALAECIKKYMDDESIRNSAELATWLRNDEAHYVRKWVNKDISDLKKLITLIVTIIQTNLLKKELDKRVQEVKNTFTK